MLLVLANVLVRGQANGVVTGVFWSLMFLTPVAGIPVACVVAVLKYRLYDLGRIVSRTVTYAIVTGLLVGVYAGLVLLATEVLTITSPVAVAGATLAAAALFGPLRSRVQHRVDHRFNRARYDAERMLAAFAARLTEELDADAVTEDLARSVHAALQPAHVSVWLSDRRLAASREQNVTSDTVVTAGPAGLAAAAQVQVEEGPDVGAGDVQGPGSGGAGADVDTDLIGQQREVGERGVAALPTTSHRFQPVRSSQSRSQVITEPFTCFPSGDAMIPLPGCSWLLAQEQKWPGQAAIRDRVRGAVHVDAGAECGSRPAWRRWRPRRRQGRPSPSGTGRSARRPARPGPRRSARRARSRHRRPGLPLPSPRTPCPGGPRGRGRW